MNNLNKPFLNWIGNKKNSTHFILSKFPKEFNNYFEPFLGSGYIYFNLLKENNSIISDLNHELINLYNVIQNNFDQFIENLLFYENNEYTFYYLRNLDRDTYYSISSSVLRATRFFYINLYSSQQYYKTDQVGLCINTYKSNQNNKIPLKKIESAHIYLQNTKIINCSYLDILDFVKPNDLVYLDPPYFDPDLKFHYNYHNPFLFDDQIKLKEFCDKLNEKKAYFFVSNYFFKEISDLYIDYNQYIIDFKHKSKQEILISNFRN